MKWAKLQFVSDLAVIYQIVWRTLGEFSAKLFGLDHSAIIFKYILDC